MINIQRNFYVDNIIKQLPKINLLQIKKLPYIENVLCFKNNNKINIYLLDVDKYKSLKTFKTSIKKIYKKRKITFLIPILRVVQFWHVTLLLKDYLEFQSDIMIINL